MDDEIREIAERIAGLRDACGYTQEEFAEIVSISRSHLSAIEAPNVIHPISLEMLFNIANALKIDPYKLLEFRE